MHAAMILAFLFVPPDAPPVMPADAPPVIPGFSIAAPDEDYATRAAANIEAAKAALKPASCPCGASCECENCTCPNCPHRKGTATGRYVSDPDPHIIMETHPDCGHCVAMGPVIDALRERGYRVRIDVKDPWPEDYALPRFRMVGSPVWHLGSRTEDRLCELVAELHRPAPSASPPPPVESPAPVASLPAGWHAHQCPSCGIRWTHPDGSTYAGAHSCPSCGRTVTRQSESSPAIRQRSFVPARRSASFFGRVFGACPGGSCPN